MTPVEMFSIFALRASIHYADDTCDEWWLASDYVTAAMMIFQEFPDYREAILKEADEQKFLWSIRSQLKYPRWKHLLEEAA